MFLNPKFLLVGLPTPLMNSLELELERIGEVSFLEASTSLFSSLGDYTAYVSLAKPDVLINIRLRGENHFDANLPAALQHGLIGTDAIFIHVSDVNLYSGTKGDLYTEDDLCDNQEPKPEEESRAQRLIGGNYVRSLIIRTGEILSSACNSPMAKFLHASMGRRHVTLNQCNRGSLISERQFVKMLVLLIKKAAMEKEINGIYNLACLGTPCEFEALRLALDTARRVRPDLRWPKVSTRPNSDQMRNFGMDCSKFQMATGTILPEWQDAVLEIAVNLANKIAL